LAGFLTPDNAVMDIQEILSTLVYLTYRLANFVNNSLLDDPAYLALIFT
jgi:hypothetical protein